MLQESTPILFLDQLDSFSYNIIHQIQGLLGENIRVEVVRYDDNHLWDNLSKISLNNYRGIVVGPGPGKPSDYPKISELLEKSLGELPVLGICLGMQIMGEMLGYCVGEAPVAVHGKQRMMIHSGTGVFHGIESPMEIGRYHSLCVQIQGATTLDALPCILNPMSNSRVSRTMKSKDSIAYGADFSDVKVELIGVCDELPMAMSVPRLKWDAVQFHPESVLTPKGETVMRNWLKFLTD